MSDKLKQYNGDFTAALHVENIATRFTTGNSADRAGANARMMMDSYLSRSRNTNQVFISYSHRDRHWFDKFQAFFKPIEEFQNIKVWDDQEILPGQHWKQAIDEALMNTQVAFCIVTPNFLASDFILRNELSYFLEESAKKRITIFWVAASKSVVEHTPLAHIQCANDPASPLDMLSEPEQNLVITEICSKLIRAMLPAQA